MGAVLSKLVNSRFLGLFRKSKTIDAGTLARSHDAVGADPLVAADLRYWRMHNYGDEYDSQRMRATFADNASGIPQTMDHILDEIQKRKSKAKKDFDRDAH